MDHLPSIQISGQAGRMDNYCRAACETGARPVPGCCPSPDLSCAGLILCGGGDMDPALFGPENRGSQRWGAPCSKTCREKSDLSMAAGRRTGSTLCAAGRALCSTGCTAPYSR